MNRSRLALAAAAAMIGTACSDLSKTNAPSSPDFQKTTTDYAARFEATAKPMFTTDGGATPFRTSKTIPYWSSTFTDPTNHVTYPYTMVGTNPSTNATTTVPTTVIPFRFTFANGVVLDGTTDVPLLLASPIFTNYTYPLSGGDVTQYGDAIQRAQFNKIGTGYHILLGQPTILPTQDIDVPANQGFAFTNVNGDLVGLMDISWFSSRLKNAINVLHVSPQTVPIIYTHNVFTWIKTPDNCCVLGYHGASSSFHGNGNQQVQTYVYASFITPRTFTHFDEPGSGLGDIHAISHEVSEWYDDPFVNNLVQPWEVPSAPQYGCTGILETGDPVVGYWFPLPGNPQPGSNGVWHPEDEVYLSWFARQVPSIAYNPDPINHPNGRYTYMGTFTDVANGC